MNPMMDEEEQEGGRRHQKKTRKVNSALKSWVAFVKKVQHEEKISYPDAMKRASKRKSEWKRGGSSTEVGLTPPPQPYRGGFPTPPPSPSQTRGGRRTKRGGAYADPLQVYMGGDYPFPMPKGGRRRTRAKRGGNADLGRIFPMGGSSALAPAAYAGKHPSLATHWKQGGRRTRRRR